MSDINLTYSEDNNSERESESDAVSRFENSFESSFESSAKGTYAVEYSCERISCSVTPIRFNPDLCIGCNRCVQVCQVDILVPGPQRGSVPIVMYPGECYYCGACVMECPKEGAITLRHPLMNRARFIPAINSEN